MIQFNLLPDVKIEFIKARRVKRMVTLLSIAVSAASLFMLIVLLVSVDVVQKKSLHDVNNDIASNTSKLKGVDGLDKILTVQNQLNTLTSLHDKKPVASRLFNYLSQVTPSGVSISSLSGDFTQNAMVLTGSAPDLDTVNRFIDTLKATTYHTDAANSQSTKAFSKVVLSSFSRDSSGASYSTSFTFDPIIFSSTNNVTLSVPSGSVSNASALFQKAGN